MHNRVTTVVLSIVAFAATTGLVIAAGGERPGTTRTIERAATAKDTARPLPGTPGTPWVGVDASQPKPLSALMPRTVREKPDRIERPTNASGSRLVVKFVDGLRLRLLPDGSVMSLTGMDVVELNDLIDANAVMLEPTNSVPEDRIQAIVNRAELHSGKVQPDIGGIFYVNGFNRDVDNAARTMLAHDLVEWAFFQPTDPYTANLVSLAEAPPAAPTRAMPTSTASMLASSLSADRKDPADLPLRGEPTGACCIYELQADGTWAESCIDTTPTACIAVEQSGGGTTRTRWNATVCAATDCSNSPIGACCLSDGTCQDLFEGECLLFNGQYEGGLTNISCTNPALPDCPAPSGACCIDGVCNTAASIAECVNLNGQWQGFGTECGGTVDPCGLPPVEVGVCCFSDDVGDNFAPLSSIVDNGNPAAADWGCFINDTDPGTGAPAPCTGNGDAPYPFGPNNPLMVKFCEIVASIGQDPEAPDFITAEDVCGDAGGEYLGSVFAGATCDSCEYYGACCTEGDCENSTDCPDEGVRVEFEVRPSSPNVWYPTAPAAGAPPSYVSNLNPLVPGNREFTDPEFWDAYLLNVGNIPSAAEGSCPVGPYDGGFSDNWAQNFTAAADAYIGFQGFANFNPGIGPGIIDVPRPIPAPADVPANLVDSVGFAVYGISCGNNIPETVLAALDGEFNYCEFSYCTNWCMGPVGLTNSCIEAGSPGAPATCSSFVPRHRCQGQLPWFCGTGELVDVTGAGDLFPVPITSDPGCTDFRGQPGEWIDYAAGLTCQDAADTPLAQAECGEGGVEDQLHGSCYWDRELFPSFLDSFANIPTSWGATPLCYNGPFCDNFLCCDEVCQLNPACCTAANFPGTDWDESCATLAINIGLGLYADLGLGSCGSPDWFPAAFPLATPYAMSCGLNLSVNNQCISPSEDLEAFDGVGGGFGNPRVVSGGCSDLQCCVRVTTLEAEWAAENIFGIPPADPLFQEAVDILRPQVPCAVDWNLSIIEDATGAPTPCVDLAQQECYFSVPVTVDTPDFTPLQFHLLGNDMTERDPGAGTATLAVNQVPADYRSLIPAPYYVKLDPNPDAPLQSTIGVGISPLVPADANGLQDLSAFRSSRFGGPGLQLEQRLPFSPSTGLYSWGEFLAEVSRGLHPFGDNLNATKGLGVRVAVLDNAAWVQEWTDAQGNLQGAIHEDLTHVRLEGRDTPHPPVRMLFDPIATRPQRGTGVLGTIAALDNNIGVTGVAPDCQPYFFPTVDVDLGFREVAAWVNAIDTLSYGDILLATYLPSYYQGEGQGDGGDGAQSGCANSCLLNDPQASTMMEIANNAGIVVIVPAGDYGCDIDATITDQFDVIAVAGAMPNRSAQRWWTSNYTPTPPGGAYSGTGISISSWGSVVTTGGNANLTKLALDIPGPADDTELLTTQQKRQSYTNDFGNNVIDGGSIAASALVAGSIACVQGLSLQRYGAMQPPNVMQRMPHDWGVPRTNPGTGSFFNSSTVGTNFPETATFDVNSDGEGWYSQRLIQPNEMGVALVTDSDYALDTAGYITDVKLLRGQGQGGTISSLRTDDQNFYSATSVFTTTGFFDPPFYVPGNPFYSSVGNYVDMMIEFTVPQVTPIGNQIDATLTLQPPIGTFSTIDMYSWNWTLRRWQFMGIYSSGGDETEPETFDFTNYIGTANEIRNDEGKIYMRAVVQSNGNTGGNSIPSLGVLVRFDSVNIVFVPGSGGGGPPG